MEFEGKQILAEKLTEKNAASAALAELHSKLLELSVIVEKDHPELAGLTEGYRNRFAPLVNKSKPSAPLAPNMGGNKATKSSKFVEKARMRASQTASPR